MFRGFGAGLTHRSSRESPLLAPRDDGRDRKDPPSKEQHVVDGDSDTAEVDLKKDIETRKYPRYVVCFIGHTADKAAAPLFGVLTNAEPNCVLTCWNNINHLVNHPVPPVRAGTTPPASRVQFLRGQRRSSFRDLSRAQGVLVNGRQDLSREEIVAGRGVEPWHLEWLCRGVI